jgi:hypothetical protein
MVELGEASHGWVQRPFSIAEDGNESEARLNWYRGSNPSLSIKSINFQLLTGISARPNRDGWGFADVPEVSRLLKRADRA